MTLSQQARELSVSTSLGDDVLLLRGMAASEQLSRLFEYQLELVSEDIDIRHSDLLGQPATVRVSLLDGGQRYFSGIVSRFSQVGFDGAFAIYQATLVPWLWFLTRTADCRIFQDKTVPDIVKEIFREHGYTDFEERLSASYRQWGYCVQYRETDFNFVSRLMEQEGIYYYFVHEEGKHTLILADGYSAHNAIAGCEEVPYYPPDETALHGDHIHELTVAQVVQSGAYAHTDFDFTAPRKNLFAKRSSPKPHEKADLEVYDYPGAYTESGDGEAYARVRLEEIHAGYELIHARGHVRGLAAGGLFNLVNYPRDDQNREYLILATDYQLQSDLFGSAGATAQGPIVRCSITAIDAQTPFRPPRATPRPSVQGPQTAIVVGKSGEEIWTDEYGRVKVQFHWDRYGKSDENSSCWVRVSHPWAGKNWGAIAIPRIGQEVIVDFLEGDPDQPIITGRVYNGTEMPPYSLPAEAVFSGVKSNSTKGGGGYNEYVMDDTQGSELIREHGQFDKDSTVEHDLREHVLHDRSRDVTNNESIQVGVDRGLTVGNNETTTIGANRTESVGGNENISIGGSRTETVAANETISIGASRSEAVGASESVSIGASRVLSVGASEAVTVGASRTEQIGASLTQTVGGSVKLSSGGPFTINATGGMTIVAPGGTKVIDFELNQIGGTIKEGYASKLDFNGAVMEVNGIKAEVTGSTNAAVGLKFEKVGADLSAGSLNDQKFALSMLNEATGIDMATLKILM
ncbi:type VI secretion system tip protein VgrG [Thiohalocapsa marina]|uniref:Type VI secretion system tip protein VgrG n=1 Tax=Thiohalocapsa marina TaxID=424902 RepID=A0A5M8FU63_9GAMM|nr:type VI secretion system tip protein VgrG [Thiohalocapsa marina]KAA6187361.1 type VI secretion system tip protein VgrG [Thiohalocapsa marina]